MFVLVPPPLGISAPFSIPTRRILSPPPFYPFFCPLSCLPLFFSFSFPCLPHIQRRAILETIHSHYGLQRKGEGGQWRTDMCVFHFGSCIPKNVTSSQPFPWTNPNIASIFSPCNSPSLQIPSNVNQHLCVHIPQLELRATCPEQASVDWPLEDCQSMGQIENAQISLLIWVINAGNLR